MTIPTLKLHLPLATILHHYGLKPDKNNLLRCPFHDDKIPSMQVYYNTNTVYCFSSNCKTNGKSLDVIDFVMYMEGFDAFGLSEGKHKAIEKCKTMLNIEKSRPAGLNEIKVISKENPQPVRSTTQQAKTTTPEKVFSCYKNALHNNAPAKEYLQSRALDLSKLEVGYNDGNPLQEKGFGKHCIIFPLKNRAGEIVSLYGRSIVPEQNNLAEKNNRKEGNSRHFYQKNRTGLYPHYPEPTTKKLILTESIIDAATLLQLESLQLESSKWAVLACYGTNGLTAEHTAAVQELKELEEIIFAFDNDKSGEAGVEKYSKELQKQLPHITFSKIQLP